MKIILTMEIFPFDYCNKLIVPECQSAKYLLIDVVYIEASFIAPARVKLAGDESSSIEITARC